MDLYRLIASGHRGEPPMLFAYPSAAANAAARLMTCGSDVCVIMKVPDECYHAWVIDFNTGRVHHNPAVEDATHGQS